MQQLYGERIYVMKLWILNYIKISTLFLSYIYNNKSKFLNENSSMRINSSV